MECNLCWVVWVLEVYCVVGCFFGEFGYLLFVF